MDFTDHDAKLKDILTSDQDAKIAFTFRDPAQRFVSAFHSRLRCGRPRNNSHWSTAEAVSFQYFETPDALARALSGDDQRLFSAAEFAIRSISHLRRDYRFHFGSLDALIKSRNNIVFASDLSDLDHTYKDLFGFLVDDKDSPLERMGRFHVGHYGDALSSEGLVALKTYWREEFEIHDWLCATFSKSLTKTESQQLIDDQARILTARNAGNHEQAYNIFENSPMRWRLSENALYSVGASLFEFDPDADRTFAFWEKVDKWNLVSDDWTYLYQGRCLEQQGRLDEAIEHFIKACDAAPTEPAPVFHLLSLYNATERFTSAEALLSSIKDKAILDYIWPIRNTLNLNRLDFASEIRILRRELRQNPDDGHRRLKLLRTLASSQNLKPLLKMVKPEDLQDPAVLVGYWEALLLIRKDVDAAEALMSTHDLSAIDNEIRRTLALHTQRLGEERSGPRRSVDKTQIIEILGSSFCGSTVLSMMLGSLDGVTNVGESHRIIKSRRKFGELSSLYPHDFTNSSPDLQPESCLNCGPECSLFPTDFRASLAQDRTVYLQKLLDQSNSNVLVAADKTRHWEVDPLARFSAIVLFKSPDEAMQSFIKRRDKRSDDSVNQKTDRQILTLWHNIYKNFLDNVAARGELLFLDFGTLQRDPVGTLEALCRKFEIPFKADVIQNIELSQHMFGGNPDLIARGDSRFGSVPSETKQNMPPLPASITAMHQRLLKRQAKWLDHTLSDESVIEVAAE